MTQTQNVNEHKSFLVFTCAPLLRAARVTVEVTLVVRWLCRILVMVEGNIITLNFDFCQSPIPTNPQNESLVLAYKQ